MPLAQPTIDFLAYLVGNAAVRRQIRTPPGKSLFYAGASGFAVGAKFGYEAPIWRELARFKRTSPEYADKQILHEVLERVPAPNTGYRSLLMYVQDTEKALKAAGVADDAPDYDEIWKALSKCLAANAEGAVSFYIGSGIDPRKKIFATTEIGELLRNPNIDEETRDVLEYFQRAIQRGERNIDFGIIRA